jgi:hypothetical protein
MISISLTVNTVEKSTRAVEMNFVMKIDQMIDFKSLDPRKSALYVTSTAADQPITSKRSEMTRRSVSLIVILNTKRVQDTIVA